MVWGVFHGSSTIALLTLLCSRNVIEVLVEVIQCLYSTVFLQRWGYILVPALYLLIYLYSTCFYKSSFRGGSFFRCLTSYFHFQKGHWHLFIEQAPLHAYPILKADFLTKFWAYETSLPLPLQPVILLGVVEWKGRSVEEMLGVLASQGPGSWWEAPPRHVCGILLTWWLSSPSHTLWGNRLDV